MTKKFLLRINAEVWEEIERWARDELRSVNGQIEFVLRQAVRERRRKSLASVEPHASGDDEDQRRSP